MHTVNRRGGRAMRRAIGVLVSVVLVSAAFVGQASARSLTVRHDPDDTRRTPDIRKVSTDILRRGVFISIGTWDRLTGPRDRFTVLLDTRGDLAWDRALDVLPGNCVMWDFDDNGTLGEFIGDRNSRRVGVRERACRVPTGWFAIRKPVRFTVLNNEVGLANDDRAPNHGRYVGL
jgi:hypothetical protein